MASLLKTTALPSALIADGDSPHCGPEGELAVTVGEVAAWLTRVRVSLVRSQRNRSVALLVSVRPLIKFVAWLVKRTRAPLALIRGWKELALAAVTGESPPRDNSRIDPSSRSKRKTSSELLVSTCPGTRLLAPLANTTQRPSSERAPA